MVAPDCHPERSEGSRAGDKSVGRTVRSFASLRTTKVPLKSVDESHLRPQLAPALLGDAGLVFFPASAAEGRWAAAQAHEIVDAEPPQVPEVAAAWLAAIWADVGVLWPVHMESIAGRDEVAFVKACLAQGVFKPVDQAAQLVAALARLKPKLLLPAFSLISQPELPNHS